MCNIMAAVGGIALLAMMGGRGKKTQEQPKPMLPQIKTDYSSRASEQAETNKGLAADASSGVGTSTEITSGKEASPGGGGYRNNLISPPRGNPISGGLPTIGSMSKQKPVNYG